MVKIPAGEFKAKCLKIMDQVKNYHEEIIITKHGKPVAKLVPVEEKKAKQVFKTGVRLSERHGNNTRRYYEAS